jgi:hypothetical protein
VFRSFEAATIPTDAWNSFIEFDDNSTGRYLAFPVVLRDSLRRTAGEALMYLKCANPNCSSDFDYGQGRLFRFQQTPQQEKQPSNWHAVKHYWLCARCCENFTIEYHKGTGILILERLESLSDAQPCYFVLQEEVTAMPVLPRRVSRSRARHKKKESEMDPLKVAAIEILENRILERRG